MVLAYAMHHHRETLIKLKRYDETKKKAHDPAIDRAKDLDNLKLSHGGPGQRQASDINPRIKDCGIWILPSLIN